MACSSSYPGAGAAGSAALWGSGATLHAVPYLLSSRAMLHSSGVAGAEPCYTQDPLQIQNAGLVCGFCLACGLAPWGQISVYTGCVKLELRQ